MSRFYLWREIIPIYEDGNPVVTYWPGDTHYLIDDKEVGWEEFETKFMAFAKEELEKELNSGD